MSDVTPATTTPVESEKVETPVVETPIVAEPVVEPVVPVVEPESENDDDLTSTDLAYFKKYSRFNEREKNKALEANKLLQSELDSVKSELETIKRDSTVNSVISEYGLNEKARQFLTATDLEGLKAQAANLIEFAGGKIPTTVTPVVQPVVETVEKEKLINPLAGAAAPQTPVAKSFGEMILATRDNLLNS